MPGAIQVQGLRELQRAFRLADRELVKELRVSLREVAEPVRVSAEQLAVQNIPRIGIPWSRMRVGGGAATSIYVAPRQRGIKARGADPRKRPNLFDLLLGRSLEPALEQNEQRVMVGLEAMIDTVARDWETV